MGLGEKIERLQRLITHDIWVREWKGSSRRLYSGVMLLRWVYLVFTGFVANQCLLRAAALAFTTVLAIAPFLAVAFSISKGLGLQNTDFMRDMLYRVTAGRTQMVDTILSYVNETDVTALGSLGVLFLFVTAISLLDNIEKAFNTIWGVKHGRTLWRKFTDFFTITVFCPVLILMAISTTAGLQDDAMVQWILSFSAFNIVYVYLLKILPYLLVILALTFMYSFMPSTKVRLLGALAGGFVAGTAWQTAYWIYVTYNVGVSRYNAIYGSFAQFPFFLFWLYISWTIVLLGAQISYAAQNVSVHVREVRAGVISQRERKKIALLTMLVLTRRFEAGRPPATTDQVGALLGVPAKVINEALAILESRGLVVPVDDERGTSYALRLDPSRVTVAEVFAAMEQYREAGESLDLGERFNFIHRTYDRFVAPALAGEANVDLKQFVNSLCAEGLERCLDGPKAPE
jgi:membrane protein